MKPFFLCRKFFSSHFGHFQKLMRQSYCVIASALSIVTLSACHGEYGPVSDDPLTDTAVTLMVNSAPSPHVDEVSWQVTHVVFFDNTGREAYLPFGDLLNGDKLLVQGNTLEQTPSMLMEQRIVSHGQYDGFYLVLKADRGVHDSYVSRNGLLYDLDIAETSMPHIFRYAKPYVLEQGGLVRIGLEINAHRGLINFGDRYQLKPYARAVDLDNIGEVSGAIAQSSIDRHCASATAGAVYVFAGDLTPDDYGSAGAQALSSVIVTSASDSPRSYRQRWLEPGKYTLAWTCDARADRNDQDDNIQFHGRVVVNVRRDESVKIDF